MSNAAPPRTCVIGAGSSGLVTVKALADAGLPFDCFEESDRVGGLWVFANVNGKGGAYRSLSINTSRERMQYADFPMPRDYPDYPHHEQIARYFAAYAEHFGLNERISFRTRVERVERDGTGYVVTLGGGKHGHYDAVVVANGHHWDPALPETPAPGDFSGLSFHSHRYVDPDTPHELRGRRVVVVGFGNSAVDIACELARPGGAASVVLSTRRGAWVLPKVVAGRPIDQWGLTKAALPRGVADLLASGLYRLFVGRPEDFGLPRPAHSLRAAHPTLSSELFPMLRARRLRVKPGISAFLGNELEFSDGSREQADAVIYATGYQVSFPFFDPALVSARDNELPLYLRLFHLELPRLYFVGLAQPIGAIMPIAEAQAKLIAEDLLGRYRLPSRAQMLEACDAERRELRARYVSSPRHTMQVDFDAFMAELERERRRGRARADRSD